MMKLSVPLCALLLLLSSCFSTVTRHTGNIGGAYENVVRAGTYTYTYNPITRQYVSEFSYSQGFTSPENLAKALKLKKEYGKDVNIILNYSHTQYEFLFDADSVIVGKPIQVLERNEEMATSLADDVKFYKTEQFNNNVQFKGFYENYAGELDTTFRKSSYLESQVGSHGIFYSDAKKATSNWSLPVPGSSVTVKHDKLYEDAKYFSMVFFHDIYPKQEGIVTFKIPLWLNLEIVERNFDGYTIEKIDSEYVIGRKLIPVSTATRVNNTPKKKPAKNKSKQEVPAAAPKFRYVTYKITNTQALREESLFPGATHNMPHLLVLCKSYDSTAVAKQAIVTAKPTKTPVPVKTTSAKNKKTPDKEKESMVRELPKNIKGTIGSTKDLYHWCYEIASLTDNKLDSVKPVALEIIKGKKTDYEKVAAIFYWVQDNIRYVAFEDGIAAFKPDACQNVLDKKYGDCKGMANLIKCMLVSVGYDARLTWIGTRRLNMNYAIPTVSNSNHMICSVVLDGKRYFLDGTEKYIGMGDYAHRIQGRPVMIEDKENYIIDTVPNLPYTRNQHDHKASFVISPDGKISGNVIETIKGENKTDFLYTYHYASNADKPFVIKKHLKDYDPNFSAQNIVNTDLNDREHDLVLKYDLTIQFNAIKDGNLLLIKPDYIGELSNNENDTNRMSNISYGHRLFYTHEYTYTIPAGYVLKQLPPPLVIHTDEYQFELRYTQAGGKIVYEKKIILKSGDIAKSHIKSWNADIAKLENGYQSYIILSKN
jgi:hypothetical protein